ESGTFHWVNARRAYQRVEPGTRMREFDAQIVGTPRPQATPRPRRNEPALNAILEGRFGRVLASGESLPNATHRTVLGRPATAMAVARLHKEREADGSAHGCARGGGGPGLDPVPRRQLQPVLEGRP